MELQVKMPDPRPCIVYADRKALFHGFMQNAWYQLFADLTPMQHAIPSAIVEFEDGQLGAVPVNRVRMLDSAEVFDKFAFGEGGVDD